MSVRRLRSALRVRRYRTLLAAWVLVLELSQVVNILVDDNVEVGSSLVGGHIGDAECLGHDGGVEMTERVRRRRRRRWRVRLGDEQEKETRPRRRISGRTCRFPVACDCAELPRADAAITSTEVSICKHADWLTRHS